MIEIASAVTIVWAAPFEVRRVAPLGVIVRRRAECLGGSTNSAVATNAMFATTPYAATPILPSNEDDEVEDEQHDAAAYLHDERRCRAPQAAHQAQVGAFTGLNVRL